LTQIAKQENSERTCIASFRQAGDIKKNACLDSLPQAWLQLWKPSPRTNFLSLENEISVSLRNGAFAAQIFKFTTAAALRDKF
jgi:hypothetical protein